METSSEETLAEAFRSGVEKLKKEIKKTESLVKARLAIAKMTEENYEIEKRLHKYWFRVATIAMTLLASTWISILVAVIFRLLTKNQ